MASFTITRPTSTFSTSFSQGTIGADYIRGSGTDDVIIGGLTSPDGVSYSAMFDQLSAPAAVEEEEVISLLASGAVTRELAGTEAALYPLLFDAAFMANNFTGLAGIFGGSPADYSYAPVTSATQALFGTDPISDSLPAPFSSFSNLRIGTFLFTGALPSPYGSLAGPEYGGNDRIFGRGGNDIIVDLEGDNYVVTGDGNDRIFLGSGNDRVYDQGGDNTIQISGGNNTVTTRDGDDTVTTGAGNDNINVFDGHNVVDAGDGTNIVRGGDGYDEVHVGTGNDFVEVQGGQIDEDTNGNGLIDIGEDRNFNGVLDPGDTESLLLLDLGIGFIAHNVIFDAGGDDNLRANATTSTRGDDAAFSDVVVILDEDDAHVPGFRSIQFAPGTFGTDTIDLGGGDNLVFDGGGNTTVRTLGGDDFVATSWFAASDDDISTGGGEDTIIAGGGMDMVRGGAGSDLINIVDDIGGPATDTLIYTALDVAPTAENPNAPFEPDQINGFGIEDRIDVSAFSVEANGFDLTYDNYVPLNLGDGNNWIGWDVGAPGVDFITSVLVGIGPGQLPEFLFIFDDPMA